MALPPRIVALFGPAHLQQLNRAFATIWQRIKGPSVWGVHNILFTFPALAIVKDGSTSPPSVYIAIQDVPAGIPLTNTDYWELLIGGGGDEWRMTIDGGSHDTVFEDTLDGGSHDTVYTGKLYGGD